VNIIISGVIKETPYAIRCEDLLTYISENIDYHCYERMEQMTTGPLKLKRDTPKTENSSRPAKQPEVKAPKRSARGSWYFYDLS